MRQCRHRSSRLGLRIRRATAIALVFLAGSLSGCGSQDAVSCLPKGPSAPPSAERSLQDVVRLRGMAEVAIWKARKAGGGPSFTQWLSEAEARIEEANRLFERGFHGRAARAYAGFWRGLEWVPDAEMADMFGSDDLDVTDLRTRSHTMVSLHRVVAGPTEERGTHEHMVAAARSRIRDADRLHSDGDIEGASVKYRSALTFLSFLPGPEKPPFKMQPTTRPASSVERKD